MRPLAFGFGLGHEVDSPRARMTQLACRTLLADGEGVWVALASRAHVGASRRSSSAPKLRDVIFKQVGDGRPYPAHGMTQREWVDLPPQQVRLDDLITTKNQLDLATLLDDDSTFYGDLFAHIVSWRDELYLEDGLHRALRAALHQRPVLHARVLVLAASGPP